MFYQKITVLITEQNKAVAFSTNTDRNLKFVKKICVYTSPTLYETKTTLKTSKDFKIGGSLMYPADFDLYPLHPSILATEKDFKYKNAKAEGSTVEGELIDTAQVPEPYYATILLFLDNEPPKEDIAQKLNSVIEELGKLSAR